MKEAIQKAMGRIMSKEAEKIIWWAMSNKDLPEPKSSLKFWLEAERILLSLAPPPETLKDNK